MEALIEKQLTSEVVQSKIKHDVSNIVDEAIKNMTTNYHVVRAVEDVIGESVAETIKGLNKK